MKSKFEQYLEQQRNRLDVETPDDHLIWNGIEKDLPAGKGSGSGMFWKVAAVVIFLLSVGYVMYNEMYRPRQNVYNITLSDIEPGYREKVQTYQASITTKLEEVKDLKVNREVNLQPFYDELNELDRMYREYQEDYQMLGKNERLIMAMLDYYDKKVRILDRMLMEIQKQKDNEKRNTHTRI